MTKKNWLLIITLVVLAGVYAIYFTDWFKPKILHISHTSRDFRRGVGSHARGNRTPAPITFGVEPQARLTEITVVPLAVWQTNQNTLPLWHLVASSNAVPVKMFYYGQHIRGLEPAVPGSRAQPLETNITYRIFVTAGKAKGHHDFEIKGAN